MVEKMRRTFKVSYGKTLLIVFLALICCSLSLIYTFASLTKPSDGVKALIVKYSNGQWVQVDGTPLNLRFALNPGTFIIRSPDFIVLPWNKYLKLYEEEKSTSQVKTLHRVVIDSQDVYALIEPTLIKIPIPIRGNLIPGTGHGYGPYYSCIAISVSTTWEPVDQMLGVAVVDAETGEGYGYWFAGGFASITFSTDWMKSYYILILSYPRNTDTVYYNGTIMLNIV